MPASAPPDAPDTPETRPVPGDGADREPAAPTSAAVNGQAPGPLAPPEGPDEEKVPSGAHHPAWPEDAAIDFTVPKATDPRPVPDDAALDHPGLYFNRELSWLDFNWRVLSLAFDRRTPLFERVRFLSITASNLDEFYRKRVGRAQAAARCRRAPPLARRPDAARAARPHAQRGPAHARRDGAALGRASADAGRERRRRDPRLRVARRARARRDGALLRRAGVPDSHAARRRPRPPIPVYLQPEPLARGGAAPPDARHRALRAPQGAVAARPVCPDPRGGPAGRARPRPPRPAGRGDPAQRGQAVPRHGGRRRARLPHHAQRRREPQRRGGGRPAEHDLRRGARAPLRRRRPARSGGRHARPHAPPPGARAGDARRRRGPDRRPARPRGPLRTRRPRAAGPALPGLGTHRAGPPPPHGRKRGRGRHLRRAPRGRPARAPPVRELRGQRAALRGRGVRGPVRARDQDDALPHQPRVAHRARAHAGGGKRQAGGRAGGAEGAL